MTKKKERQPLGAHVALSVAQLEDAGIPEDVTEDELGEIIDDFLLSFSGEFAATVEEWLENRGV